MNGRRRKADRLTLDGTFHVGTAVRAHTLTYGPRKGEKMAHARAAAEVPFTGPAAGGATQTVWVRLVAYGEQAETLEGVRKGARIAVSGRLGRNAYPDPRRNGQGVLGVRVRSPDAGKGGGRGAGSANGPPRRAAGEGGRRHTVGATGQARPQ